MNKNTREFVFYALFTLYFISGINTRLQDLSNEPTIQEIFRFIIGGIGICWGVYRLKKNTEKVD